jgi:hypothetical protein
VPVIKSGVSLQTVDAGNLTSTRIHFTVYKVEFHILSMEHFLTNSVTLLSLRSWVWVLILGGSLVIHIGRKSEEF